MSNKDSKDYESKMKEIAVLKAQISRMQAEIERNTNDHSNQ